MKKEAIVVEETPSHPIVPPFKRISWSAILVGALVGVGLSFLLNLFGIAIGLSAYTTTGNGATVLAIGGLIGIIIGIIAAMFVAGFTAGYLGRLYCPTQKMGILYGFATWTVALILSAFIAGHFSHHVNAYTNAVVTHSTAATNQQPAAAVTVATPAENKPAAVKVDAAVTSDQLAWSAAIVFALFFIGALAACLGGCWGMCCKRDDMACHRRMGEDHD